MSVERALSGAVFIGCLLLLVQLGPAAVRSWRIYAGTGRRRQEDATGRAPSQPPTVADRASLLAGLGYHRLGETRLVLPAGERFGWICAADDAESYAILVAAQRGVGLTGIYSAWLDGTWLCTLHPIGQAGDRPGLHVRIVTTTIEATVLAHRDGLERLRGVHGPPRAIRTMADMLALDADYRTRFGGSRIRPTMARVVLPAIGIAVLAALSLALVIVSPR